MGLWQRVRSFAFKRTTLARTFVAGLASETTEFVTVESEAWESVEPALARSTSFCCASAVSSAFSSLARDGSEGLVDDAGSIG
jgi:hypothetical protein